MLVRAVVQRVRAASVSVDGEEVARVGPGLCVLLGVAADDAPDDARRLGVRVARLRIFENDEGKLDRSVADIRGEALVVSQFTLIADTAKGNRPSFGRAAGREQAESLYRVVCAAIADEGVGVATGAFGARMLVEIANDGPVTLVLET